MNPERHLRPVPGAHGGPEDAESFFFGAANQHDHDDRTPASGVNEIVDFEFDPEAIGTEVDINTLRTAPQVREKLYEASQAKNLQGLVPPAEHGKAASPELVTPPYLKDHYDFSDNTYQPTMEVEDADLEVVEDLEAKIRDLPVEPATSLSNVSREGKLKFKPIPPAFTEAQKKEIERVQAKIDAKKVKAKTPPPLPRTYKGNVFDR